MSTNGVEQENARLKQRVQQLERERAERKRQKKGNNGGGMKPLPFSCFLSPTANKSFNKIIAKEPPPESPSKHGRPTDREGVFLAYVPLNDADVALSQFDDVFFQMCLIPSTSIPMCHRPMKTKNVSSFTSPLCTRTDCSVSLMRRAETKIPRETQIKTTAEVCKTETVRVFSMSEHMRWAME